MIKPDYPSVLLIYTGGTIGMIENPETGALEAFNFDQLQENVPELKRFNYRISSYQFNPPSEDYIAIVRVEGTIQEQSGSSILEASSGYQHDSTMNYIDELMDDSNNKGILLYVDSPGGTVYESEELYQKLKE